MPHEINLESSTFHRIQRTQIRAKKKTTLIIVQFYAVLRYRKDNLNGGLDMPILSADTKSLNNPNKIREKICRVFKFRQKLTLNVTARPYSKPQVIRQHPPYLSVVSFEITNVFKSGCGIQLNDIAMNCCKQMTTVAETTLQEEKQGNDSNIFIWCGFH